VLLRARTFVVHDLNETAHSPDVTPENALRSPSRRTLAPVRGHEWAGDIGRGLTALTVKVRNPEITHIVKVQDFEN
jgi:hypothetical protein